MTHSRPRRTLFHGLVAIAVAATTLVGLHAEPVEAIAGVPGPEIWDPDTSPIAGTGSYITVGSTIVNRDWCGNFQSPRRINLPYIIHNEGQLGHAQCYSGDLLPSGPGSWAASGSEIWAPSIVKNQGTWFLHYTAIKAGTANHRCIGMAYASSVTGPYTVAGESVCPSGGRWAIDPDVTSLNGTMYMVYRDDAVTSGNQTGISAVALHNNGYANWPTRRTLLTSANTNWGLANSGVDIVENPTLAVEGNRFYLLFSGSSFDSSTYATGVADCGSVLLDNACAIVDSASRPDFGYVPGLAPRNAVAGNRPGLAALNVYKSHSGETRASAAWWPPMLGGLWGFSYRRSLDFALPLTSGGEFSLRPLPNQTAGVANDFDGDRFDDVLTVSSGGQLCNYRGDGQSGWVSGCSVLSNSFGSVNYMMQGDMNGDGYIDIVARTTVGTLCLFRGNGANGFVTGSCQQIGTGFGSIRNMALADFDSDGDQDIIGIDANNLLRMYVNSGTGTIAANQVIGHGWQTVSQLATGDFDGDGNHDLIAQTTSGGLTNYRGNGASGFLETVAIGSGWGANRLLAKDFSGDGRLDIITRNSGGLLHMYRGNGTGGWITGLAQQIGNGWGGFTDLV